MGKTSNMLRDEFWAEDKLQGGGIFSQYQEIKNVLMNTDMHWVLTQLRHIKSHAIDHTDFYKDYSIDDEFPIVDKISILKYYEEHKAKRGFQLPIHTSSTSGSTGTPFSVLQDSKKRMRTIADLKVLGEMCDYPSHERMVLFRVMSDKNSRTLVQEERENIYYVDSSDLSDAQLKKMVQILYEKTPRIVFSYPSTLMVLAKYIHTERIDIKSLFIKSVLASGEGLYERDRRFLEQVFGCKVYRRYANMESGILAQDSGGGSPYILNYGSFYFECLKQDSDIPTDPGEIGRIVITDLFNYAFPMIRYDTGDLGIMEHTPTDRFPVLNEIYGRVRDCIYTTSGNLLHPAKLNITMWEARGVNQWQFIQEDKNEYMLKLNGSSFMDVKMIVSNIKDVVGKDSNIKVELVEEIPILSSSKRRAVICNYNKENGKE